MKPWHRSETIQLNGVLLLWAALLASPEVRAIIPPKYLPLALAVAAAVNIWQRFRTSVPIQRRRTTRDRP